MDNYLQAVITDFRNHGNPNNKQYMKAYMKNKFDFIGIKSPDRRLVSKSYLSKESLPPVEQIWPITYAFWDLPEREFQYFAMELTSRYSKLVEKDWINHYESLIISKSWWDTVDFIAVTLAGHYFKTFPDMIIPTTANWMKSGNIWLQRSCLLFQLKYKKYTDTTLLASFIIPLSRSKEFFIAKAIGWALREYGKSDPEWVLEFVQNHTLQSLSKREAIRRLI
jgi:3-methyladenine DNA glycosylase AlkD